MPKATVYNMAGQQVGEVELSEGVFGVEPNEPAVHAVVVNHLANCRQGTQSALTRAEVSGGGKKPWRQKGTGHARQGSTRAPQWTHGGIVFAPKPRSYRYRLNKKLRRLALKSALSDKAASGNLLVVDDLKLDEIKADTFVKGDHIDVTGISKGKGYQGVIKRWNAARLKESHGTGPVHRHAGSMGSGTDPSRIFKGKIGAGQMGNEQITVQNLDVVSVDPEFNLIAVCGAVPGPKGGIVYLKSTVKTIREKKGDAGTSINPQKASARANPQKASARHR